MNDIQDIILESEYNVLNSLYEYYNKQYIMESYYMEDGESQPSDNPQKENLIKRFIEWCKRFFASIKAKFKKVPPKTPVPEAYAAEANQLNQMTQTYTQINSQNSNTQQQIEQNEQLERQSKIVQIKEKKQQQKPQQQTQQQSNQLTMETIEQNIQQVQTVINNVEQEIVQMDSIASQAQDAVNPEKQKKRKAAEAKVKTGSSLLQKLGELFGTIANTIAPVARIEGEPLPDPKYYGQKVIDSIKKATTIKDVQTIYNNAEKFYISAYKWYSDRAESPSQNDASLREGNYCKNKCTIIQQWRDGIRQVQEQRINELNQQSNQMPGVNATTPQPTQPAPTQTTQPSQQAPTPAPQPTTPQPTPNAQDNVNPQPAPVQQTPPPTNNAMNGGQLFQLVQQLRNNGNNFRVFNAATNKVEYSTDGNSAYIINGNLLYPNKTSRSKTLDINPAVFDVNTKLIDDTSSITPATVDQGGFITQKGNIG